jgi:hypothetical protein
LLQNIQYPSDHPRLQRHFKDFVHYKANEIKNFLLNAAIYVFSFVLKEPYYSHFVKYILFLRLLTQSRVSNNEIQLAARLINYFVLKYENLYGRRHLTYNLHSHLHLPLQVFLFGPLHMVSCFPFEGFFKICNGLYSGTRAIAEQIIRNLSIRDQLSFVRNFTGFKFSADPMVQNFLTKLKRDSIKKENLVDTLLNPILAEFSNFTAAEQFLIRSISDVCDYTPILTSTKLRLNRSSNI